MADKKQLYKDQYGQRYATPSQPSFDTMQKVGIPNYVEVPTNENDYSYEGSHVRSGSPEKVYFSKYQADNVIGNTSPNVSKKDVKERILAHELQHQLAYLTRKKEQVGSAEQSKWASPIDEAWAKNAEALGFYPRQAYKNFAAALNKPEVQKRLQELNWPIKSRLRSKPEDQPLQELLADLSALETNNKIDITKDPVFNKHLFSDDADKRKLYKSVTGMSGAVIGDSDYKPYSLEAQEAWHGRDPSISDRIKNMIGYRQGGLTAVAQHLESKGRGNDHMLVHMTPREVAGLEAIARAKGGQLTINPQTGLLEAGFLDDVLPIAASAALMYFGGPIGASLGSSLGLGTGALAQGVGMGLLAGGATTLLTGDINKGLKTGLTAGVLSGGMSALSGPAAADVPTANVETATPALQAATTEATAPNAFAYNAAGEMVPANYPSQVTGATNMPTAPTASTAEKSWWGGLSPKEKLGYGLAGTAGLSLLGGMQDKGEATPTDKGTIRPYTYSTAMRQPQSGQSQYFEPIQYDIAGRPSRPIDTSERTYFNQGFTALPTYKAAAGGEVPPNLDHMTPGGLAAIEGMRDGYGAMTTTNGDIPQMANGGAIAFGIGGSLGGYSDGGRMLKGPGDGMSDSIPGTINNKQPARLADGEFVVPADVVSHLGNGSTDAGAKRLYNMMDRVRQARTGTKKQGKQIKADKYLPK